MRIARQLGLVLGSAAVLAGCTLTFTADAFQTLRLFFELTQDLPEREETVVQTLLFPAEVNIKKRFLRISGSLDGDVLPDRVEVVAESTDTASGERLGAIKTTLKIDRQGTFRAVKKLKQNVAAGTTMTIVAEPIGADLPAGTKIALCVDVLRKRGDARSSECSSGGEPGPSTFSDIQEQIFTPTCALAGCHDAASASQGLVLEAESSYANLVNVPSNQVPFLLRVDPRNADGSYLLDKLRGSAGISGVRMPIGGPFLTEAQLDGIEAWIDSGAPQN